jgi:hypothetical protein
MIRFLTLILAMVTVSGADAQDTHPSTLAGLSGATMVDSGVIVITSTPEFAREESFEYVRRPDGGITLLNTITATDGRFRTRARFDMDADWNALSASGLGLYEGVPVEIFMQRNGAQVDIQVHGEGVHLNPTAVCDPDCFINMSPTTLPMFVMTRHYDRATGGVLTGFVKVRIQIPRRDGVAVELLARVVQVGEVDLRRDEAFVASAHFCQQFPGRAADG